MIDEEKLMMLLNEPVFRKLYEKDKSLTPQSKQSALKRIFANEKMVRRYKALMEARYMAIEDLKIDENIDFLIKHLEAVEEDCADRILKTQKDKDQLLQRFNQRQIKQGALRQDMYNIQVLAGNLSGKLTSLRDLKMKVDRSLQRTEIVKALAVQNRVLKEQNERLSRRDQQQLQRIDALTRQLMQKDEQIRFLRRRK